MKKYLDKLFILLFAFLLLVPSFVFAEKEEETDEEESEEVLEAGKEPVVISEFYSSSCGYCAALNSWFESIEETYGDYFDLVKYEVSSSTVNSNLMEKVASHFGVTAGSVPFTIIGENYITGFDESTTSTTIINYIIEEYAKDENDRVNVVADIKAKMDEDSKVTNLIVGIGAAVVIVGLVFVIRKARTEE